MRKKIQNTRSDTRARKSVSLAFLSWSFLTLSYFENSWSAGGKTTNAEKCETLGKDARQVENNKSLRKKKGSGAWVQLFMQLFMQRLAWVPSGSSVPLGSGTEGIRWAGGQLVPFSRRTKKIKKRNQFLLRCDLPRVLACRDAAGSHAGNESVQSFY